MAYSINKKHLSVGAHAHFWIVLVLFDCVSEALLQSFAAGEPRLLGHHAAESIDFDPCLAVVDLGDGPLAGVHSFHKLLHVLHVHVVPEHNAYAVDHNQGTGVHGHCVARAHDNARSTGRDSLDNDVHLTAESFQRVVDCDPGVEIAAAAIELDGDVSLVFDCCQILHEALRRDKKAGLRFACPPVNGLLAHNVAVESDLSLVVAGAGHIPELCRRGSLWSSSRAHD